MIRVAADSRQAVRAEYEKIDVKELGSTLSGAAVTADAFFSVTPVVSCSILSLA